MSRTLSSRGIQDKDFADEDSMKGMSALELQKQEELSNRKAFTFLSGDAVRWMNKRRPKASSSSSGFIAPSRVLQLRAIFRGLDFDNSGEISLQELKDAVRYVSASQSGSTAPPLFEDPDAVISLFESMDIDGNGAVDFNEFLLGMTSESAGDTAKHVGRMKEAFYDFANKHRRQMIIDKIKDESIGTLERYGELTKLYNIKFLKKEVQEVTVQEMIAKALKDAKDEKAEMQQASERLRKLELKRARAAAVFFEESTKMSSNQASSLSSALKRLTGDKDTDDAIMYKATNTVSKHLANFPMAGSSTYEPPLAVSKSLADLRRGARDEALLMRAPGLPKTVLIGPPISHSQHVIIKARSMQNLPKSHEDHRLAKALKAASAGADG